MGKTTEAPKAPDPVVTANAQAQANQQTAQFNQQLNMVGSNGPTGSVSWAADPNQPGGYTQTTTLSPQEQQTYDLSKQAGNAALGVANQQIGRVGDVLGQGFDTSGLPALQGGVQGGQMANTLPMSGDVKSGFDMGQQVQGQVAPSGQVQQGFNQGQQVQGGINQTAQMYGFNPGQQVQGQVGNQDLYQANLQAQEAAYQQAMSRLNPQFDRRAEQERTRLANQGISQNNTAYANTFDQFGRDRNDAMNQAIWSSVGAGNAAQQQLFNQQLGQGQFANQAAGQQYAQNQGMADFYNQAANNQFSQGLAQGQFANQAAGQQFNQGLQGAQFGNAAQQQQYGQNAQSMQLANQAAQQQYAQNMGQAQFQNAAQEQQFGQGLAGAQFQNAAQQQAFQQAQQNAQLGNTARQQGVNEQAYIQNLPLNQFNSLMSSSQVGTPQGIAYTPSQQANTDVLGAYALQSQVQQANYQAQQQQQAGLMGGLAQLGSAAIFASDIRLKKNIRYLYTRPDTLNVYAYDYVWGTPSVGVMAQEVLRVKPEAVVNMGGYLAVDYGQL